MSVAGWMVSVAFWGLPTLAAARHVYVACKRITGIGHALRRIREDREPATWGLLDSFADDASLLDAVSDPPDFPRGFPELAKLTAADPAMTPTRARLYATLARDRADKASVLGQLILLGGGAFFGWALGNMLAHLDDRSSLPTILTAGTFTVAGFGAMYFRLGVVKWTGLADYYDNHARRRP